MAGNEGSAILNFVYDGDYDALRVVGFQGTLPGCNKTSIGPLFCFLKVRHSLSKSSDGSFLFA